MYQITIDGRVLKTMLSSEEAIYWETRLPLLFPQSTFTVIYIQE